MMLVIGILLEEENNMSQFTGKQSVLDGALGEYTEQGFTLREPDDHVTQLYFKDNLLATYNQTKVTFETLQKCCQNYLKELNNA